MRVPVSLLLLLFTSSALAQAPLPRLELGLGLLALGTPDYRGSQNSSSYLLPVPYIKIRGERWRVDEGAQGVIFESDDLLFTLSANLSLPADDNTPERVGMDELEAIFEIGPSLNYRFYRSRDSAWWIDLPLRFAFTLDSEMENIGQVFQPRLAWRKPATSLGEWKLRLNLGPLYSSAEYHDYFYSVSSSDVTATRPAYDAGAGFSGYRGEFTYSKRIGKYWFGGFLRYDNLRGSEIEDSPLVSETESWMAGISLAWVFHQR